MRRAKRTQHSSFQKVLRLSNFIRYTIVRSLHFIEVFGDCLSLQTIVFPISVKTIGSQVFNQLSVLKNMYYEGSESDWSKISIDDNNEYLTNATSYYYSESEPVSEGNYWRCVDGAPTAW